MASLFDERPAAYMRPSASAPSALGDAMLEAAYKPDLEQLRLHHQSLKDELSAAKLKRAAEGKEPKKGDAAAHEVAILYDGGARWKRSTVLHMACLARKIKRDERTELWTENGLGDAYADVVDYIFSEDPTGSAVSRQDEGCRTPLHLAAWRGHGNLIHRLLRHDTDPRVECDSGKATNAGE